MLEFETLKYGSLIKLTDLTRVALSTMSAGKRPGERMFFKP